MSKRIGNPKEGIRIKLIPDPVPEMARTIIASGGGDVGIWEVLAEVVRQLEEAGRDDVTFYRDDGERGITAIDLRHISACVDQNLECR